MDLSIQYFLLYTILVSNLCYHPNLFTDHVPLLSKVLTLLFKTGFYHFSASATCLKISSANLAVGLHWSQTSKVMRGKMHNM